MEYKLYTLVVLYTLGIFVRTQQNNTTANVTTHAKAGSHFNLTIGKDYHINFTSQTADTDDVNVHLHPVAFFSFEIKEKIDNQDLIILVKGRQDVRHSPYMYFSAIDEEPGPNKTQNATSISCGILGMDMCTIEASHISEENTYNVGVFCLTSCEFDVKVIYQAQKFMRMGDQQFIQFKDPNGYSVQQVRVYVPDDSNLTHIIFQAFLLNQFEIMQPFHVYINKGNVPPTVDEFHYEIEEIWSEGLGILIDKEQEGENWQTNINYTLLIEAPAGASILIKSEGFGDFRKIRLNEVVHDMLGASEYRLYMLEIPKYELIGSKQNQPLSFDIEPFYGSPDIFVNPDNDTHSFLEYRWKSIGNSGLESLSVTEQDRDQANATNSVFYVGVFSKTPSSYSLIAYVGDTDIRYLTFGGLETGYLSQNDIISYQLYIYGLGDTNITITTTAITGALNLYAKRCYSNDENEPITAKQCKITQDEIKAHSDKNTDDFMFSELVGTNQKFIIPYNSTFCSAQNYGSSKCIYIIALYGKSDSQTNYRLTAKHPNTNIKLTENENIESSLEINEKEFYQFTVLNETNLDRVEIYVKTLIGNLDVYSSRNYRYPDYNNNDNAGFLAEDELIYYAQDTNTLAGTYYIGVNSQTYCKYVISVKVYRQNNSTTPGKNTTTGGNSTLPDTTSSQKKLYVGQADYGQLSFNSSHKYKLNSPENMTDVDLFIYFQHYNKTTGKRIKSTLIPSISIIAQNKNGDSTFALINKNYSSIDFLAVEFSNREMGNLSSPIDTFSIEIYHLKSIYSDVYIQYTILVNSPDIMFVIPQAGYIGELDFAGPGQQQAADQFEIYLVNQSQFYLEVFQCIGQVEIKASDKREYLEAGNYNVKPSQPPQNQYHHELIVFDHEHEGPFYFAVEAKSSATIGRKHLNETLYMIIPHIVPNGMITPHQLYYPSSDLNLFINYSAPNGYEPIINFKGLGCQNNCENSPYNLSSIIYILHVTNQRDLLSYFGDCGLDVEDFAELKIQEQKKNIQHVQFYLLDELKYGFGLNNSSPNDTDNTPNNTQIFTNIKNYPIIVNLLKGEGPFYAQVMAVAFVQSNDKYGSDEPFTFIYDTLQFNLPNNPNKDPNQEQVSNQHRDEQLKQSLALTVVLGFGLLFLIAIITFVLYKKFCQQALDLPVNAPAAPQNIQLGDNRAPELNLNDDLDVAEQYKKQVDHIQFFDKN